MAIQLAFGRDGDVDLWCEDRGIDEYGGQRFWVINGHWEGVYHRGKVWVDPDRHGGRLRGMSWPGKLLWRGKTPFASEDYNEAMAWLRSYLGRRPDLKQYFERMEFSVKKKSFSSVVEELDTADHNERVEALASAYREVGDSIVKTKEHLAKMEAYHAELAAKGETAESLTAEEYSELYNRHFSFR